MSKLKAIYPGSFDPVTMGHMDIIQRAGSIFDRLYVAVAVNNNKDSLFSPRQRVEFLQEATADLATVRVVSFQGLLVETALDLEARVIVKGLRAVSDYEYELQMAHINKKLGPHIETMFLPASTRYSYLSSSLVKEVAALGGCVETLVPAVIHDKVIRQFTSGNCGNEQS